MSVQDEDVDLGGVFRWQQADRGERRLDVAGLGPGRLLGSLRRLLQDELDQELGSPGGRAAFNPLYGFVAGCFDSPGFAAAFCDADAGHFGLAWYLERLEELAARGGSGRRLHCTASRLLTPLCSLAQHQRGLLAPLCDGSPAFLDALLRSAYASKAVYVLQLCVEAVPPGERQLALLRRLLHEHLCAELNRILAGLRAEEEERIDPVAYMRIDGLLDVFLTLVRNLYPGYAATDPAGFLRLLRVRELLLFVVADCRRRADVRSLQKGVLDAVYALFCVLLSFALFRRSAAILHEFWKVFEDAFEEGLNDGEDGPGSGLDGLSVLHVLCYFVTLLTYARQVLLFPESPSSSLSQAQRWGYNTFIFERDEGGSFSSSASSSNPLLSLCPTGPTAYAGIGGCLHQSSFPTAPAGWSSEEGQQLLTDLTRFLVDIFTSKPMGFAATEYFKTMASPMKPAPVSHHMARLRNIAFEFAYVLLRARRRQDAQRLFNHVLLGTDFPSESLERLEKAPRSAHVLCTLWKLHDFDSALTDNDAYRALVRDVHIRQRNGFYSDEDDAEFERSGEEDEEGGEGEGEEEGGSSLLPLLDAYECSKHIRQLGERRRYRQE
ncbi:hypothetical protein GMRT_16392 [Giardia muris]|uniref:Uncharacterized protein n=1 Tax=Giardia muris TaxID=5742 RepID=A0A4Z1SY15_GIAMU|nr:hypothetical protein GMRT_16392 [Giardia muris]|eukprot:TNJ26573.1 hypothetical protein GMRT_16392 [Giardia muris]